MRHAIAGDVHRLDAHEPEPATHARRRRAVDLAGDRHHDAADRCLALARHHGTSAG
jgi:hypothetical protein